MRNYIKIKNYLFTKSFSILLLILVGCGIVACENENSVNGSDTLDFQESDPVTDYDGNVYRTIKIGNQIWMAENLKTTRFNDGREIPYVWNNSDWLRLTSSAYCWPNNDSSKKDIYGALYNWYAVNTGKLEPVGWHIPSEDEWKILINYVGGEAIAGSRLEETGFKAQGAGQRTTDFGIFNLFPNLDKYWTTTKGGWHPSDVKYCVLTRITPVINWSSHPKAAGHSVRCVKD